ncbi:MAG: filamentous hemagglutinin N-terminal domain-containing protein, partial [Acidobacteriota bacterium]|nr:filamentous hemagglutinin N-terminal domain-containing protein [Acidobacteriota bacterium]
MSIDRRQVWRAALAALVVSGWLCGPGPGRASAQTTMPQGGQVVQGNATIASPSASQMVITQSSQRAVVNWNGFSIGPGGVLQINQPNASSAILNRVTGSDLSVINGQLRSNGQVYLLNPHGVVIGPGGTIDTAAFLASVLHVSDQAFMAGGPMTFAGDSTAGILNLGTIHASTGDVALFGPAVANRGTIDAPNGTAALVSGSDILFAPGGRDAIYVKAPVAGASASVDNSGVIKAAQVELKAAGSAYALAVNNSGLISATAVKDVGGRVILDA